MNFREIGRYGGIFGRIDSSNQWVSHEFPKNRNREFNLGNREFSQRNREFGVSVRALHACFRLYGCDLLSTVDSVKEEGDRAKNDGREALGTGIVLAGAFGRLAA